MKICDDLKTQNDGLKAKHTKLRDLTSEKLGAEDIVKLASFMDDTTADENNSLEQQVKDLSSKVKILQKSKETGRQTL